MKQLQRVITLIAGIPIAWLGLLVAERPINLPSQKSLAADFNLTKTETTTQDSEVGNGNCTPEGCNRPVFDRSIPQLISPRATALTSFAAENLVVQWSGVEIPNYTPSYTVTVRGLDGSTWQEEVTDTTAIYDGDPLQPGGQYIISVDAHTGEPPAESIFRVMSEQEEAELVRQIGELDRATLSDAEYAVSAAKIYRDARAFTEAIDILETAIARFPDLPAPYCELISVYQERYPDLMALDVYGELVRQAALLGVSCTSAP